MNTGRRRVTQVTGIVIATAIALTAALDGIVSQTAAGGSSKQSRASSPTAPAGQLAPDDQQVYPDPTPSPTYESPGAVVTRSS